MRVAALATVLASLEFTLPAAAADPGQEAVAQFKADAKVALAAYKENLVHAATVLKAAQSAFEARFADLDAGDDDPAADLVVALAQFQDDLVAAREQFLATLTTDAASLLGDLTDGGADENACPKGLGLGDGSTLDRSRASAESLLQKEFARARKSLAKARAKLRAQTGHRIEFVLATPSLRTFVPANGAFLQTAGSLLGCDLAVTLNRGGLDGDGQLWASGIAAGADDVDVTVSGPTAAGATVPVTGGTARWTLHTDPLTEPLDEGNDLVNANQGFGAVATAGIGMPRGGRSARAEVEAVHAGDGRGQARAGFARQGHEVEAAQLVAPGQRARDVERRAGRLQQARRTRVAAALAVERAGSELDQALEQLVLRLIAARTDVPERLPALVRLPPPGAVEEVEAAQVRARGAPGVQRDVRRRRRALAGRVAAGLEGVRGVAGDEAIGRKGIVREEERRRAGGAGDGAGGRRTHGPGLLQEDGGRGELGRSAYRRSPGLGNPAQVLALLAFPADRA